jgi:hypothetical protein
MVQHGSLQLVRHHVSSGLGYQQLLLLSDVQLHENKILEQTGVLPSPSSPSQLLVKRKMAVQATSSIWMCSRGCQERDTYQTGSGWVNEHKRWTSDGTAPGKGHCDHHSNTCSQSTLIDTPSFHVSNAIHTT